MQGLLAAAKVKTIFAETGWIRVLLPSPGPWVLPLVAGLAPGGLLAVMGLNAASFVSVGKGGQCGCK